MTINDDLKLGQTSNGAKKEERKQYSTLANFIVDPAFSGNAVVLLLTANQEYVPYLSTMLASVLANINEKHNYDIILFTCDIIEKEQQILIEQYEKNYVNVKLRFFNITDAMQPYQNLYIRGHFRLENYFRLLAPDLLPLYHKVIYLDCDMIVQRDIAELYDTEIPEGHLLAACKDAATQGFIMGPTVRKKNIWIQ